MTPPAVYQLLGFPAVGKYTVAREIAAQLRASGDTVKLLDNHTIVDLLFQLTPAADGKSRLPESLSARIADVKEAVLRTIDEISPREWSFVFTNFIRRSSPLDSLERLRDMAARRGAAFVPVLLTCDEHELMRRLARPDRGERGKMTDPGRMREYLHEGLAVPEWPELLTIDVTTAPPSETAATIITAANGLPTRGRG